MQQRMELFGGQLPQWLVRRFNYGMNLYEIGKVMHTARDGQTFFEQAYHGIHNLDVSQTVQLPHEMLLAMNLDEILALHAGTWLIKMDDKRWRNAVNKKDVWEVVSAVLGPVYANASQASSAIAQLRKLAASQEDAYGSRRGELQRRLRELPPRTATTFMQAFTYPFRSPNNKQGYTPISQLKEKGRDTGLDVVVFGHFAGKFAEGERQLSIATS